MTDRQGERADARGKVRLPPVDLSGTTIGGRSFIDLGDLRGYVRHVQAEVARQGFTAQAEGVKCIGDLLDGADLV
jgi:hypothetical protein